MMRTLTLLLLLLLLLVCVDPNAPVASYEDMCKLQLRRVYMERMLFEPYFA